jgi:hypothetical protein
MKAKVITSFVDKSGKLNTAGSEVDFESSRMEALIKKGYVVKPGKKSAAEAEEKKPDGGA